MEEFDHPWNLEFTIVCFVNLKTTKPVIRARLLVAMNNNLFSFLCCQKYKFGIVGLDTTIWRPVEWIH